MEFDGVLERVTVTVEGNDAKRVTANTQFIR